MAGEKEEQNTAARELTCCREVRSFFVKTVMGNQ